MIPRRVDGPGGLARGSLSCERGPLITLTRRLKDMRLMAEEDFLRLQQAANTEVDDAVQFAEQSPLEPVEDLQRFVYAEGAQ